MTILEKITNLLDSASIQYKKLEHEAVFTSEQAAQIRGSSLDMGAKAIICYADTTPILIVVPGDMKIDFKAFKQTFGIKDLRMATPDEVLALTGLKIGSIPPVGKALGLKSYYDENIKNKPQVAFNAGSHTTSIFMAGEDLGKVEDPYLGKFAVLKGSLAPF